MHYHWGRTAPIKRKEPLWAEIFKQKKQWNFDGGWFGRQQDGLNMASNRLSSERKRFAQQWNKVERKSFQVQQTNQLHSYN